MQNTSGSSSAPTRLKYQRVEAEVLRQRIGARVDLSGAGLEIAPYFNPILMKDRDDVTYTDYVGTEELREKARGNPVGKDKEVPAVDFVWRPGSSLASCDPSGRLYDFALAAHVIEHVPDTVGWIREVFAVLKEGAILALVVPDRRKTNDFFRPETTPADLVENWLRAPNRPTPRQIFDFVHRSINEQDIAPGWNGADEALFNRLPKNYGRGEALGFVRHSWTTGEYLDVHCTVWTPDSFINAMVSMAQLGLLNCHVREPIQLEVEFIVFLEKRGEASPHPGPEHA